MGSGCHSSKKVKLIHSSEGTATTSLLEQSPISKLHGDILWQIFSLNGHADACYIDFSVNPEAKDVEHPTQAEAALTTLRRTSQVCRVWRNLLVNAPTIWATSLDLQCLDQIKDDWRNEVLRRTGDRPLTIIGNLYPRRPCSNIFKELLSNHWTRIRRMFVCDFDTDLGDELWDALQLPSPNLELLRISNWSLDGSIKFSNDTPWFANCAPRLRGVEFNGLFFNTTMNWFVNIRELWNLDICVFSVSELLHALEKMPQLEALSLHGEGFYEYEEGYSENLTPAQVPSLKVLILDGEAIIFTPVLRLLVPAENCRLQLDCIIDDVDESKTLDFTTALSTFFRNSPRKDLPHLLSLPAYSILLYALTATQFSITSYRSVLSNDMILLNKTNFSSEWNGILCNILKSIPLNLLSSVLEFFIILECRPPCSMSLFEFSDLLTHLKYLAFNWKTLKILNEIFRNAELDKIFCPGVEAIYLHMEDFDPAEDDALKVFLAMRRDKGVPIKEVYLRGWESQLTTCLPFVYTISKAFECEVVLL